MDTDKKREEIICDANNLLLDRNLFNTTIYTPLNEAITLLKYRKNSEVVVGYDIPEFIKGENLAVLSRHITTPNEETELFLKTATENNLKPIFFEYNKDIFVPNNKLKKGLGKLIFNSGKGEAGNIFEYKTIIDFNSSNGKTLVNIDTLWGESLISFHHRMLSAEYPDILESIHDGSSWFYRNGDLAKKYYKSLLAIFIKDGILFENFLLDKEESEFTSNIVLPAFIELYKEFGMRPLIVALDPTQSEEDRFWLSYNITKKKYLEGKISI